LYNSVSLSNNTAIGSGSLFNVASGDNNVAIGADAASYVSGDGETAVEIVSNSVFIGKNASPENDNQTNQVVIGYNAIGKGSNTIQLGNSAITSVSTYGKFTSGTITYPNTDGTADQVLKTNGSGVLSWTSISTSLVSDNNENTKAGTEVLIDLSSGMGNSAYGYHSLHKVTTASDNNAFGREALYNVTTGSENTAFGSYALNMNTTATQNTAVGVSALRNNDTGSNNTAVGRRALISNYSGSNLTAIGDFANVSADGLSNATALGNGAIVNASDKIQLGNSDVTSVSTYGALTTGAVTYPNIDGTNGQVLTTDGSGTLSWATASGGSTVHTIGESYGGGIVFFVYDGGQHGLIASTADQSTAIRWYGGSNTITRARADGIGAGQMNTAIMTANQAQVDGGTFAATVCNEYSVTVSGVTYGGWYLPSKYELSLLYAQKDVVGSLDEYYYWSSTEHDSGYSWIQCFDDGSQGYFDKYMSLGVRAIRAF
jgi:hypothetical protein